MTATVQEFVAGKLPITVVKQADTLADAVRRMLLHDYSQLPVVSSDGKPIGIITGDSVLSALRNFGAGLDGLLVKHATDKNPQLFKQDIDLLDLFDDMDGEFAFVVDDEDRLVQIVTTFDTTEYFRQRARDILLVENIESTLKDYVQLTFLSKDDGDARLDEAIQSVNDSSYALKENFAKAVRHYLGLMKKGSSNVEESVLDEIFEEHFGVKENFSRALHDYLRLHGTGDSLEIDDSVVDQVFEKHVEAKISPAKFDELTLGNYISLFLYRDNWQHLEPVFELEKAAITCLLDAIRKTRNDLSHFREIGADQSRQLRECYDLLVNHQDAISAVFATQTTTVLETTSTSDRQAESSDGLPSSLEDEPLPGESRYAALAIWLQEQPSEKEQLSVSFDTIEQILGGELPGSAYKNRSWWANDSVGHVQSKQWLDVGWRIAGVNMTEQVARFARIKDRQRAYIDFYNILVDELQSLPGFDPPFPSPDGTNWYSVRTIRVDGQQVAWLNFAFGRGGVLRVELYIDSGEKEANKPIFDALYAKREDVEEEIGSELEWQRLDNKRASRVARIYEGRITDGEDELHSLAKKAASAMGTFSKVMEPRVMEIARQLL